MYKMAEHYWGGEGRRAGRGGGRGGEGREGGVGIGLVTTAV